MIDGPDPGPPPQPLEPSAQSDQPELLALPPLSTPPERVPFWSYGDLLIFLGLTLPCMLLAMGAVKVAFWVLHFHPAAQAWSLLAVQLTLYGLLFGVILALFRLQYDQPLWRSLGWVPFRLPLLSILTAGIGLAMSVMLFGALIRVPRIENPLTQLLKDPTSLVLLAVYGSIVAPVCEELLFRGFLQPLLVRSLGAVAGILAAAIPFGLLHFQEYGNSWRHVLLISISGVAFGAMRHLTGSTKAAAATHAVYNGFQFVLLLAFKNLAQ